MGKRENIRLRDRDYSPEQLSAFQRCSKRCRTCRASDTGYEEGESLQEAEAEIGIADRIDPETGELAEDLQPHLSDE